MLACLSVLLALQGRQIMLPLPRPSEVQYDGSVCALCAHKSKVNLYFQKLASGQNAAPDEFRQFIGHNSNKVKVLVFFPKCASALYFMRFVATYVVFVKV